MKILSYGAILLALSLAALAPAAAADGLNAITYTICENGEGYYTTFAADAAISDADIEITDGAAQYTVTFKANTDTALSGMPGSIYVSGPDGSVKEIPWDAIRSGNTEDLPYEFVFYDMDDMGMNKNTSMTTA